MTEEAAAEAVPSDAEAAAVAVPSGAEAEAAGAPLTSGRSISWVNEFGSIS